MSEEKMSKTYGIFFKEWRMMRDIASVVRNTTQHDL